MLVCTDPTNRVPHPLAPSLPAVLLVPRPSSHALHPTPPRGARIRRQSTACTWQRSPTTPHARLTRAHIWLSGLVVRVNSGHHIQRHDDDTHSQTGAVRHGRLHRRAAVAVSRMYVVCASVCGASASDTCNTTPGFCDRVGSGSGGACSSGGQELAEGEGEGEGERKGEGGA